MDFWGEREKKTKEENASQNSKLSDNVLKKNYVLGLIPSLRQVFSILFSYLSCSVWNPSSLAT